MRRVFADTSYYLALMNQSDAWHAIASHWSQTHRGQIVTTDFVLTEVGNAVSRVVARPYFAHLITELRNSFRVTIVPASRTLFDEGYELYSRRSDKDWSLTDCISFLIMSREGLTDALTSDHHFEQAGFTVLLK